MSAPVLTAVKAAHTAVFLGELAAILWLVITGLTGRRDRTVLVAGVAVAAEAVVFVVNRGVCPLTTLAEREGAASGRVSDIFLPRPVADTIPAWSSALVALGLVAHAIGVLRQRRTATAP